MARGLLRGARQAIDSADVHGAGAIEPRSRDVYSGCGRGGAERLAGLRGGVCAPNMRGGATKCWPRAFRCWRRRAGSSPWSDVRGRAESSDEIRRAAACASRAWWWCMARRMARRGRDAAGFVRQRRRGSARGTGAAAQRPGVTLRGGTAGASEGEVRFDEILPRVVFHRCQRVSDQARRRCDSEARED